MFERPPLKKNQNAVIEVAEEWYLSLVNVRLFL
jgi:hypothetical protein